MKSSIFSFVMAGCFLFATPCEADQTDEPPQKLVLQIGGQQVEFVPGEEIRLTGHYSNPTARLLASPTRHFSYGGICFEYPAGFSWEADAEDDSYRSWTMSGNECVIIYLTFADRITPATFAASLREQYGPSNTEIESINRSLGSMVLPGKRVIANIAGTRIVQDVLDVPAASGHSRLLVLQDMTESNAGGRNESKSALELLSKSFRVTD